MKQLPIVGVQPPRDPTKLYISECFGTIQGEGSRVGTPSIFLRLFGCNLTCGDCDTQQTWHPYKVKPYQELTVREVAEELRAMASEARSPDLVITGGEPLLQQDALDGLFNELRLIGAWPQNVTVETNGSVEVLRSGPLATGNHWLTNAVSLWSVSPKLGTPYAHPGYLRGVLYSMDFARDGIQIKVVCKTTEDLEQARELRDALAEHTSLFYIQPEWGAHAANIKWCRDFCIKNGLRVLPQMHKVFGIR